MRRLDSHAADFESRFETLIDSDTPAQAEIDSRVAAIIADVRARGDSAVVEYTRELDRHPAADMDVLEIAPARLTAALEAMPAKPRAALETAAARIRSYAESQKLEAHAYEDEYGNRLGQVIRPIERAGVYAPGGKAAYPSSVLMNALPAQVAGVSEIIMVSPAPGGEVNDWVLAAAALAGVDRFFTIGGAQAVAALAYGTQSVPCVDKIVGPGNAYVAEAKRQVFGRVGIESVAGPSEVLILADGSGDPEWAALDLFAQAEHGEDSRALLISPDNDFLGAVEAAVERLLEEQPRRDIIRASLANHGALIAVADMAEAVALSNRIAPEHLELAVDNPDALLDAIEHAGAIFMGHRTPEAFGDYCAGPNHVLPTGRTARFSSALGVYDFQKRLSIIHASARGAAALAPVAEELALGEGLHAHAASARVRANETRG
ncbi:Histidinol dehydrogenase protein [Salinisphaera shabanensis E1L3A]|jgi:histidinol dehydrogenase|uniref:Histidinol dehydrogenase n=1 Tax=Salinisphaera shabanensis E1L3A TaxID=1033802 RepID=U2EAD0_9GAMM|nr:histidinol dehydrogenase [Salinisphaera shabanensis]ERJ20606.1 Histidinol dehydrogenase protein [Salinisphaera shabanensis E1L3A]